MNLVLFKIADKEYGVDIKQVLQVIRMKAPVRVPEAAQFVEGVITVGGKVVPLVNLRKKMGLSSEVFTKSGRILLTETEGHLIGVMVDSVTDVIAVERGSITPPDDILKDARYLLGVVKLGNRLILAADMAKVLNADERTSINDVRGRVEIRKKGGENQQ